jgi:hypothetical protein
LNNQFDDEKNENGEMNEMENMPMCPYCVYGYRQFPSAPPPFPGGMQGPPGFGQQSGYPQFPGGGFPGYGPPSGPPPSGPPPSAAQFGAQGGPGTAFVSPNTIRRCLHRYVYIWIRGGRSFWAWLVYADRRSIAGWRWNGRRWVYFGMDLRRIDGFSCY